MTDDRVFAIKFYRRCRCDLERNPPMQRSAQAGVPISFVQAAIV